MRQTIAAVTTILLFTFGSSTPALAQPATLVSTSAAVPGEEVFLFIEYEHMFGVTDTRVIITVDPVVFTDVDLTQCGGGSVRCSFDNNRIRILNDAPEDRRQLGVIGLTLSPDAALGSVALPFDDEDYDLFLGEAAARGSVEGRVLVVDAADSFENDNMALSAQPVPPSLFDFQSHTHDAPFDEDWMALPDAVNCAVSNTWRVYAADGDSRFQPVIEIYPWSRLTDASVAPHTSFSRCEEPAEGFPTSFLQFSAAPEGLWRFRNCPGALNAGESPIRYVIEREPGPVSCGSDFVISGRVVDLATRRPVLNRPIFVETELGVATVVDPTDGTFFIGLDPSLITVNTLTLFPLSQNATGEPVTLDLNQPTNDVVVTIEFIDALFADGFE